MKITNLIASLGLAVLGYALSTTSLTQTKPDPHSKCDTEMFGNSTGSKQAATACQAFEVLQHNWYPDPLSYIFSYQTWNGFDGFWQNGAVLESIANFHAYSNSTRYQSYLFSSLREVYELTQAYGPEPSYDDMAWYGMSYARIHEVHNKTQFIDRAHDIYNWNWKNGWDKNKTHSCQGFYWDDTLSYKASITNAQMLLLGSRLYRHKASGHKKEDKIESIKLHEQVERTYDFIQRSGMINNVTNLVYDSVQNDTCAPTTEGDNWTYTQGIMLSALADMSLWWKNDERNSLQEQAINIANATIEKFQIDNILTEIACENKTATWCNNDARIYKGLFVRSVKYLIDVLDQTQKHVVSSTYFKKWISHQAATVQEHSSCNSFNKTDDASCYVVYLDGPSYKNTTIGPVYTDNWASQQFNYSAPMMQASALDLFNSDIPLNMSCHGDNCSYDPSEPPYPPTPKASCSPNPCPPGQPCCEYYGAFTCCNSDQKCNDGLCE